MNETFLLLFYAFSENIKKFNIHKVALLGASGAGMTIEVLNSPEYLCPMNSSDKTSCD